jgi:hypothetical protein
MSLECRMVQPALSRIQQTCSLWPEEVQGRGCTLIVHVYVLIIAIDMSASILVELDTYMVK